LTPLFPPLMIPPKVFCRRASDYPPLAPFPLTISRSLRLLHLPSVSFFFSHATLFQMLSLLCHWMIFCPIFRFFLHFLFFRPPPQMFFFFPQFDAVLLVRLPSQTADASFPSPVVADLRTFFFWIVPPTPPPKKVPFSPAVFLTALYSCVPPS